MTESLDIALYYAHEQVGTWPLMALAEHRGVIHPDDLEPDGFLDAVGAMGLYHDRYHCILLTGEAVELVGYVYFLIESLVATASGPVPDELAWRPSPGEFAGFDHVLSLLQQEDQSAIILSDGDGAVELSYLDSEGDAPETRLSPYFTRFRISTEAWRRAAWHALEEYFEVASERIEGRSAGELGKLVEYWKRLRGVPGIRP